MTTQPAPRRSHHRDDSAPPKQRGRPSKRIVVIDYDAAPPEQPQRLRKPQLVRRWNVRTGQIEESWE